HQHLVGRLQLRAGQSPRAYRLANADDVELVRLGLVARVHAADHPRPVAWPGRLSDVEVRSVLDRRVELVLRVSRHLARHWRPVWPGRRMSRTGPAPATRRWPAGTGPGPDAGTAPPRAAALPRRAP